MSRNPHSYGALAVTLLRQPGEAAAPSARLLSLLLSARGEGRVQRSRALGQRGHLSSPENTPHLSPTPVSPSAGEKASPIRSLGQDKRPLLPFASRRDRNGYFSLRQLKEILKNTHPAVTPCHVLLRPAENVSEPLSVQGPAFRPITPRTSQRLPTPFPRSLQREREGRAGAFLWD